MTAVALRNPRLYFVHSHSCGLPSLLFLPPLILSLFFLSMLAQITKHRAVASTHPWLSLVSLFCLVLHLYFFKSVYCIIFLVHRVSEDVRTIVTEHGGYDHQAQPGRWVECGPSGGRFRRQRRERAGRGAWTGGAWKGVVTRGEETRVTGRAKVERS